MPRASRITLLAFFACLLLYALVYVPRLANPLWSDVEFTGWVSPIAHRMVEGQRIYRDFTLPIPPASFALLAAVQLALGRFALLDELWVCAIGQMIMLGAGWFMVRSFTSARTATLVTIVTSPILISTPKEIAYDQTALAVAWVALALLARALTEPVASKRLRWLAAVGLASGLVVAFKSSTGIGSVGGVGIAVAAITWIAWRRGGRPAVRVLVPDWLVIAAGGVAAAVVTLLLVVLLGGSPMEFYRVVFVDGPMLKGGRGQAVINLLSYTILQTPMHVSFLSGLIVAWAVARVVQRPGAFEVPPQLPDEQGERGVPGILFAAAVGGWTALMFGLAALLLAGNAVSIPLPLRIGAGFGGAIPVLGLLFLVIQLVASLRASGPGVDRRGAFVAVTLAAGFVSLAHNLSDPTHRPFYDNNPVIPMAIFSLFFVLDQARLRALKAMAFGLMLMVLFGGKYQRYLDARFPAGDSGYWQGLRVSSNGLDLLRAAARARELAGPSGTVLMLPEDPMFESLVGRPRPPLRGAIVFVDQFPERLLQPDLEALLANPPDVLIIHPRDKTAWHTVYSIWNVKCAAARLHNEFTAQRLESSYRLDSSFDTWMFRGPGTMDIFARQPPTP